MRGNGPGIATEEDGDETRARLRCEQLRTALRDDNDEELFHLSRQHVQNVHPDIQISDEDLRSAIAPQIYDVQEPRTT
jgi:hypothetical protein